MKSLDPESIYTSKLQEWRSDWGRIVNRETLTVFSRYPRQRLEYRNPAISHEVLDLHRRALIVDLHSDPLLWNKDLNNPWEKGHVDFPKLRAGGVKAQFFGLPSGFAPLKFVFELMAWKRGWPSWARQDYYSRVKWQILQLDKHLQAASGQVSLVRTPQELEEAYQRNRLGVILAIEGGQCVQDDLGRLEEFFNMGVRAIAPAHFDSNRLGGNSFIACETGRKLTPLGRELIQTANKLGMLIDLAHASEATFFDILAHSSGPVMVSHTGVKAVHPLWRNLNNEQIQAVAERNGVIGVIFEPKFLGGWTIDNYIEHVEHIIRVAGIKHVGLGSDWDGGISLPLGMKNAGQLPLATQKLWDRGFREKELRLILGENFLRVFKEVG